MCIILPTKTTDSLKSSYFTYRTLYTKEIIRQVYAKQERHPKGNHKELIKFGFMCTILTLGTY